MLYDWNIFITPRENSDFLWLPPPGPGNQKAAFSPYEFNRFGYPM